MELQDQIDTGRQAEEFLRYTSDHPYFEGLIQRMQLEYAKRILDLAPDEVDAFRTLRVASNAVGDIKEAILGDIYLASEALKQREGIIDKGGIL